jgi:hypothetical protein
MVGVHSSEMQEANVINIEQTGTFRLAKRSGGIGQLDPPWPRIRTARINHYSIANSFRELGASQFGGRYFDGRADDPTGAPCQPCCRE